MVSELQFSRPIALLHGALLGTGKAGDRDEARHLRLEEALKEVLKRAGEEERRRVNLFLFINTNLSWKDELACNDAFSALVGLVEPPIEVEKYLEVVGKYGLWPSFLELLHYLPPQSLCSLPSSFVTCLPSLPQVAGVALACRGKGPAGLPLMREAIAELGKQALNRETLDREGGRAVSLATILTSLKTMISGRHDLEEDRRHLYAFADTASESDTVVKEEIASLLLLLKTFLLDFSTLHWVGMVEVPSTLVLQHPCLPCWHGDHPPSNMQLLCAHIASELLPLLNFSDLAKEVALMLSPLSSAYTREVELGLADRDVKEMIASLATLQERWQQEAIVAHIMVERLSEVAFPAPLGGGGSNCGAVSVEEGPPGLLETVPPDLLAPHLSPLLDLLLGDADREVSRAESALVIKVTAAMGEEMLAKTVEEEVTKRGVHTRLCPPDLNTMFTSCINKASLDSSATTSGPLQESKTRETKEDFLRLGLLGGARMIRLLLEEGSKHKGQAATVAGILSLLHPVCSYKVGGGGKALLPVFIGGMLSKREEFEIEEAAENQERKNLVGVSLALLRLQPSYTQDLLLVSLPLLLADQDLLVASFMDQVLRLSSSVSLLNTHSCLVLGVSYVHLLNSLSHASVAQPLGFKLKELCLSSLRRLLSKKESRPLLEKCMSECTGSYFQPSSTSADSLLFQIHSAYWGALPSSSPTSSISLSSLPLILPLLLPKEWDLLVPTMMQIATKGEDQRVGFPEALHRITDCLLSLLPHLPSPQRRSLLLSYSTILSKEGGEYALEELCTLINVFRENEEETSLLWTALHSLLTEDKEEKEDMLAWLEASPRSEGRDTAVRILLQREKSSEG